MSKIFEKNATRLLFVVCLTLVFPGCAVHDRGVIRRDVSPNPMTPRQWEKVTGVYVGPVRSANRRFGSDGTNASEMRMEVFGTPDWPQVYLKMRTDFSSTLVFYGERTEVFTNMPERRYGEHGTLSVTSHYPGQLLIRLKPQILSPAFGGFLVVTFVGEGCADVEFIEHAGRKGHGTLKRLPNLPGVCRE